MRIYNTPIVSSAEIEVDIPLGGRFLCWRRSNIKNSKRHTRIDILYLEIWMSAYKSNTRRRVYIIYIAISSIACKGRDWHFEAEQRTTFQIKLYLKFIPIQNVWIWILY